MIGQTWMKWAVLEAGTKTASKMLQKVVGTVSSTWSDTFLAAAVIGFVQTIFGGLMIWRNRIPLFSHPTQIIGCCLFGLLAVGSTALSFGVFLNGGEIGVNTFIITLSIVPEAFIDAIFFKHKLTMRELIGISVAIIGGYVILGSPSLAELAHMPLWVWISFATTLTIAIGQGVTRQLKDVSPFVKNFWGGLTGLVLCGCIVMVTGGFDMHDQLPLKLLVTSAVIGLIVVGMWSFSLMSYKGGASIALKKLVTNGVYLTAATCAGALFFGEKLTTGTWIGIMLYFVAFALVDGSTWKALTRKK